MSKKEIRLRVSDDFYAMVAEAAKARDIPITALLSIAAYNYVGKSKPNAPLSPMWRDDDEDILIGPDGEPLNVGS